MLNQLLLVPLPPPSWVTKICPAGADVDEVAEVADALRGVGVGAP